MNNTEIKLNYQGIEYTLAYTRAAVKILESNGFEINSFLEKPMSNIELAFQGAFIKNHPKVSQATIAEIYKHCPNKQDLLMSLYEMISETYNDLFETDTEDESKNVTWKTVNLKKNSSK